MKRPLAPHLSGAVLLALALLFGSGAQAQTTAFSYQSRLDENGNPATGQYDFEFKLF